MGGRTQGHVSAHGYSGPRAPPVRAETRHASGFRASFIGLGRLLQVLLLALWPQAHAQLVQKHSEVPGQRVYSDQSNQPTLRFADTAAVAALGNARRLLTDEERGFLKNLPPVRVAVRREPFEPYETLNPDGTVSGIHPNMLVAFGKAFGFRVVPVVYATWPEMLDALRNRQADLMMTLGITSGRSEFLEFTLGATPAPGALFARPGQKAALETARFALERDYLAVDYVRRQFPKASIQIESGTIQALRTVAVGRADYYLGSLLEAIAMLAREPVAGAEANRLLPYSTGYYHYGVRKDWPLLATVLNKGIRELRAHSPPTDPLLQDLPPRLRPPPSLALDRLDAATLVDYPVWRVGAVRGLSLLNDVDERGLHSGIAAEYIESVARRLGTGLVTVSFDTVAHMLDGLRNDQIDVVPFITRTEAHQREFALSAPYLSMPYVIVARVDGPLYWGIDSLVGRRLALTKEHPLRELLALRLPGIRVVDAVSSSEAMDMVADGRADATAEVKLFANLRINSDNAGRLRATGTVEELPADFYMAVARPMADLLSPLNRALFDISPAERQRMLRRWVAVDLAPVFHWRRYLPLMTVAATALLALAGLTWWWMRRLKREVVARTLSERKLFDIASTAPCITFRYEVDGAGRLRNDFVSPGADVFLGTALDESEEGTVFGSVARHMPQTERQAAAKAMNHSLSSGERFDATVPFQPPGQPLRWLHTQAVRSSAPNRDATWTGYVIDITTLRELQDHQVRAAQQLNLLLATASHELRAPTHNLSLALQTIRLPELPEDAAKAVQIARVAAAMLGQLLNDVLDAAKADSGGIQLRPQAFDLAALMLDLQAGWEVVGADRGLSFAVHTDAGVPRTVVLDPLRLKQVLTNLLSNAFKYTAAGRVDLTVTLTQTQDAQRLLFEVSDTGVGISQQDQARLFQPYASADGAPLTSQASTGLGLLVARKLTDLMGGTITLASEQGQGTRVTVALPLVDSVALASEVVSAATSSAPTANVAPRHVLVCDDDPVSRMLMVAMLRQRGLEVGEAMDAQQALGCWRQGRVDVLITDLDLPGANGWQLMQVIRAEESARVTRTVVVVCSGSPVPVQARGSERQLYDAFLNKPVQMETLVDTLRGLEVDI